MMADFPGKGKVAIIGTQPATVVEDVRQVMRLAGYQDALPKDKDTILKINISWDTWYPACSSTPWQLEGAIQELQAAGYPRIIGAHNDTVVVDARDGEDNNKHRYVTDKYGIETWHLYEPQFEWVRYEPKEPLLVLDRVYPEGIYIPKDFYGRNVIQLPTVKCVHPDTKIVLADGTLARIGDMVNGTLRQGGVALLDEDGDTRIPAQAVLLSLSDGGAIGPQTTRFFWRTPLNGRKIWRVRTKTGREVKVSSEHPFLTPQGWRKASDLQVGDRVAIPRDLSIRGVSQPLPSLQNQYGKTSTNWIRIPDQTSPEFWRWVGYFTAEGWMQPMRTTCRFWWSNGDPVIQQDFVRLTEQLFGLKLTKRPENPNDYYFDALQMREFFSRLGLEAPLNAGTKHVPELLFRCPDDEIAGFLQGYFDGDASVDPTEGLAAVTKSQQLALDVQYLLNRLGVIAFLGEHWSRAHRDQPKRRYWLISVYSDEAVTLSNKVRLLSSHKRTRLELLAERRAEGKRPSNWDTIPVASDEFRRVRRGLGFTQASTGRPGSANNIEHQTTTPTRPVAQYFVELFQQADVTGQFAPQIAEMAFMARPSIAWDHVREVEEIEADTDYLYDFTMDCAPNFVGNGLFLHNTHVFTTITGAMKNAFGGLLHRKRHWTHAVIHETVVDLLQIQQDIHTGVFAVMDGTFAGDGPGPRAMRWHEKDILLASADQVAIDAMSAYLQGFDPMTLDFIRLGHERGLGVGDPEQIEIVGMDKAALPRFGFVQEDTFASRGQKMIYHGWLKGFEGILLRSPLVPWSYAASNLYHNYYWYPFVGRKRVQEALDTKWGRLFQQYGDGEVVMGGIEPEQAKRAALMGAVAAGGALFLGGRLLSGLLARRS